MSRILPLTRTIRLALGSEAGNKSFGVQHVNAYHHKFKDFIRHLCGVATKYLDNYLAWLNILYANGDAVGKKTRLGKIGTRMVYLRSRRTFVMRPVIPLAVAA